MLNKLLISLLSIMLAFAGFAQENPNISISGILNNANGSEEIHLKEFANNHPPVATSKVAQDGSFSLIAFISDAGIFRLQLGDENFISLIIDPGEKISIHADADNLNHNLNISGSVQTTLLYTAGNNINLYELKLDSINKKYKIIHKSVADKQAITSLREEYSRINTEKLNYITEFIKTNPESLASLFVIEKLDIADNFKLYDTVDKSLFPKYPDNTFVKNLHSRVENQRKLAIGSLAPEIILPDPDGNLKKLSSLRGKVVLIDFWAAWCGPCRRENPNLVLLYSKYHDKGFEVLGVSLDKSRDSWLKAIESDKLVWTQISDLKFWNSEAAKEYQVKSIPHTVLLDREGRIIAKKLRGKALEEKVQELLSE
ncbi:MAG: AhpC/TSA family protein [Bacteroidales bacterium]|nr:AhpC/TSA family protein [Bacteroidales bacterium]